MCNHHIHQMSNFYLVRIFLFFEVPNISYTRTGFIIMFLFTWHIHFVAPCSANALDIPESTDNSDPGPTINVRWPILTIWHWYSCWTGNIRLNQVNSMPIWLFDWPRYFQMWYWLHTNDKAPFQYPIRRLIVGSRKVSTSGYMNNSTIGYSRLNTHTHTKTNLPMSETNE